jgi:hypothetical protein
MLNLNLLLLPITFYPFYHPVSLIGEKPVPEKGAIIVPVADKIQA